MPAPRLADPRTGYRSAQDLIFIPSFLQAPGAFCAAGCGTVCGSATIVSFYSLHRLVEQNIDFQFLKVVVVGLVMEAFKVSPRDRVQQRLVEQISLTFRFHAVESSRDRFLLLHLRTHLVLWRLLHVFLRTFLQIKKSATTPARSRSRVPAHSSSSTPAVCEEPHFSQDGNIYHEDEEKIWVRLDTRQWTLLCTDIVVDQPWP